jgi:hypothetical protein
MAALAMGACLAACGSSDDKPAGSASGAVEACSQVCVKQGEKMCPNPFMITVDQCKQLCAAFGQASAACQAEIKAQSDCQLMQSDICMSEAACSGDGGTACM